MLVEIGRTTVDLAETEAYDLNHDKLFRDDFGTTSQASRRWIIGICISLLLSLTVWQPIMIYIYSWVSIWSFHHSKSFEMTFTHQVYMLLYYLCYCCSCKDSWCEKSSYKKKQQSYNFKIANLTSIIWILRNF